MSNSKMLLMGLALLSLVMWVPQAFSAPASHNEGEIAMSREVKTSIELAQEYLARNQRSDGSFAGSMGTGGGIVGTGCMAWMVNGNLPGEGRYGKNVALAIDYIIKNAQPNGLLVKKAKTHGPMYQHGLAAICLAEAWGHTRNKEMYDKLKKAIDLIIRCQNDKGGWRYQPKIADADLSVTVIQLLALRGAKDAGMNVPKETIELAVKYVESCRTKKDKDGLSGFGYSGPGGKKFATTSAGVMSLMLCGSYKAGQLKDGLDYIMYCRKNKKDRDWYIYGHYYAALAMYQTGNQEKFRNYWLKWYPDISKELVGLQEKSKKKGRRGRFRSLARREESYGVWNTAMSVLILGLPYRYLPIYQR